MDACSVCWSSQVQTGDGGRGEGEERVERKSSITTVYTHTVGDVACNLQLPNDNREIGN